MPHPFRPLLIRPETSFVNLVGTPYKEHKRAERQEAGAVPFLGKERTEAGDQIKGD